MYSQLCSSEPPAWQHRTMRCCHLPRALSVLANQSSPSKRPSPLIADVLKMAQSLHVSTPLAPKQHLTGNNKYRTCTQPSI
jgi:hypothetical protein